MFRPARQEVDLTAPVCPGYLEGADRNSRPGPVSPPSGRHAAEYLLVARCVFFPGGRGPHDHRYPVPGSWTPFPTIRLRGPAQPGSGAGVDAAQVSVLRGENLAAGHRSGGNSCRVLPAGRFLVPADTGRRGGYSADAVRIPGSRRCPSADLRIRAGQRDALVGGRRVAGRHELDVVDEEAHPAPRRTQPDRQGSGHRAQRPPVLPAGRPPAVQTAGLRDGAPRVVVLPRPDLRGHQPASTERSYAVGPWPYQTSVAGAVVAERENIRLPGAAVRIPAGRASE